MYKGSSSPFDYMTWNGDTFLGLECKLLKSRKSGDPKSLPFGRIPQHQRDGLLKLEQYDNSKTYILCNFRWTSESGKGTLYALSIGDFLRIEQKVDRKSISLDMFDELAINIDRYGKGWDLRSLL